MTENGISVSKTVRWVSYVVSALPVLMLAFSATLKFIKPPGFNEGIEHLGWTEGQMFGLGVIEFAVAAVYLVPRTAVLGAILIAAYMGGAVAAHIRVGDPFVVQIGIGVLAWLGLWMRDTRLRALIPIRRF